MMAQVRACTLCAAERAQLPACCTLLLRHSLLRAAALDAVLSTACPDRQSDWSERPSCTGRGSWPRLTGPRALAWWHVLQAASPPARRWRALDTMADVLLLCSRAIFTHCSPFCVFVDTMFVLSWNHRPHNIVLKLKVHWLGKGMCPTAFRRIPGIAM